LKLKRSPMGPTLLMKQQPLAPKHIDSRLIRDNPEIDADFIPLSV
jgi:hypothetical protein